MFVSADTLTLLSRLGVAGDDALKVILAFEGDMLAQNAPKVANAERQARHRAKKAAEKAGQRVTDNVISNVTQPVTSNADVTPPRAHVRDITSNLDNTGKITSEAKASSVRVLTIAKPNGFALFWEAYPAKVGKRDAEKAYERALKRIAGPDPPSVIMAGVATAKTGRKWREGFIPNPATWLNRDGWEDQPEPDRSHERDDQPSAKFEARQRGLANLVTGAEIAARSRAVERAGG